MRRCNNFIKDFEKVANSGTSPKLFSTWAGLTCVAGALERRCWTQTRPNPLTGRTYPTMCTLIVASGGVGKADPVVLCSHLWRSQKKLRVAPESLTAAAFYDCISSDFRQLKDQTIYQPLLIATEEIASFFTQYEHEILGAWVKAYDCRAVLDQLRRHQGGEVLSVENPSLSFIMAAQPELLEVFFPDMAYAQGFMGRAIIVYSTEKQKASSNEDSDHILKNLEADMEKIANLEGTFKFSQNFLQMMQDEEEKNHEIVKNPPHPRLQTYFQRKHQHAVKIAMALSASYNDKMILTDEYFSEALKILEQTEKTMVHAYRIAVVSEDSIIMDSILEELIASKKGGISAVELWKHLSRKVSAGKIESLIKAMVNSGRLQLKNSDNSGAFSSQSRFIIPSQIKESQKIKKFN